MNDIEWKYTEYDEIALGYNTIWPNIAQGYHVWNNPFYSESFPFPILYIHALADVNSVAVRMDDFVDA